MKYFPIAGLGAVLSAALAACTATTTAIGQELPAAPTQPAAAAVPSPEEWYYRASTEREPTYTLAEQKAHLRGAQRMARLEALRWYGFSNSRPVATAMPYTTMYSPAWQQPGGRPFAWHTSQRPLVIITQPAPLYR